MSPNENTAEQQQPQEGQIEQTQQTEVVQTETTETTEAADVLDGAEELIHELDEGKATMSGEQTDPAYPGDKQASEDNELDKFDFTDVYNNKLQPLVAEIERICNELKIPFIAAFTLSITGEDFTTSLSACLQSEKRATDRFSVALAAIRYGIPGAMKQIRSEVIRNNPLGALITGDPRALLNMLSEAIDKHDAECEHCNPKSTGADAGGPAHADAGGHASADAAGVPA